jgi:hypothetical protein
VATLNRWARSTSALIVAAWPPARRGHRCEAWPSRGRPATECHDPLERQGHDRDRDRRQPPVEVSARSRFERFLAVVGYRQAPPVASRVTAAPSKPATESGAGDTPRDPPLRTRSGRPPRLRARRRRW